MDHPLTAGIFAIQVSLLEGIALDPPRMIYKRLQDQLDEWVQQGSSRHPFFEPFIGAVLNYYQEDESQWTEDLKTGIRGLQKGIAHKLITVRNGIYFHALCPKKSTWKERYRLWQTLLMYDEREIDHLASLPDHEFRQSDYWQVFTWAQKHNRRLQGSPMDIPLTPPEYRGQEILFPQLLTQSSPKGFN